MLTLTEYHECEEALAWVKLHMFDYPRKERVSSFINRLIVLGWTVKDATAVTSRWID